MCEVTKDNFEDIFPWIEQDIKDAKFVAIDTEFTGLKYTEDQKPSLFDGAEERYRKLKETINRITPLQIGVAAFKRNKDENKYTVNTYNFALYPTSFGPIDVRFICQASSLKFLCKHDFDFNKAIYKGISFLNEEQEHLLRDHLEAQDHIIGLDRDIDEGALQDCCSEVAQWLTVAHEDEVIPLYTSGIDEHVAMTEIRERFSEVWAYMLNGQLMIEKMNTGKKTEIMLQHRKEEYNRIMNDMLGFTRVFRILAAHKKILVGHNHLMDLMIMYDKFHKPLPNTFFKFKSAIHAMFPAIYDTKHISIKLRMKYEDIGYFGGRNLEQLYASVSNKQFIDRVLYSPGIANTVGFNRYDGVHHPHEAGYDAFMCGYAFIRMAHFTALVDIESMETEPQSFAGHLSVMKPYENRLNIIRGKINHTCLDDKDPPSYRPDVLYVQSRRGVKPFTMEQLARMFSPFGSVDIKMTRWKSALVAVSTRSSSRDILRKYHKHDKIYVARYRMWKHSPIVKGLLGVCAIALGGSCVWILWTGLRDTKS